jgi:hypothetical protein
MNDVILKKAFSFHLKLANINSLIQIKLIIYKHKRQFFTQNMVVYLVNIAIYSS